MVITISTERWETLIFVFCIKVESYQQYFKTKQPMNQFEHVDASLILHIFFLKRQEYLHFKGLQVNS